MSKRESTPAFQQAITSLPNMKPEERERLRKLLDDKLVGNGEPEPEPTSNESMLLSCARVHIKSRNGTKLPEAMSYLQKAAPTTARQVRKADKQLEQDITQMLGRAPQRNELEAAVHLYVRLATMRLEQWNVPISLSTLAKQAPRFPALVDAAYPGYIVSGLLRWVLRPGTARPTAGPARPAGARRGPPGRKSM